MGLLELAARTIPMGTAYAVWAGIGEIGTVIVGMFWFEEPATTVRLLLILGIVACIAGLKLIVTNDSGPMHIAGALEIPSVAIFGPTNHVQTCQWRNPRFAIVRHEVPCAPCMQRTCPLGHHACMRGIEPQQVLDAAWKLVA